jgi:predicted RNase H-like HicB family nuclease
MKYLVVFTKEPDGTVSAEVPDLPVCTSYGDTQKEAEINIKEAIELHLSVMREEGMDIPVSAHLAQLIEVE